MMSSREIAWTAIVLTCQTKAAAHAYQTELDTRQKKGIIAENVILLTVEDPLCKVGSGGATLNALLVVTEHISARQGFTVVNPDVLQNSHILIFHMGRQNVLEPCGPAFLALPCSHLSPQNDQHVCCNIDILLDALSRKLAVGSPPGVWLCSTDMMLHVPESTEKFNFTGVDVCAVSVPGSVQYATKHGVYQVDKQGYLRNILYQASQEDIRAATETDSDLVPLVSGVVYFSARVAERLLSFHTMPPLDSCTYMGLDSGVKAIQLSLFFDLMLAMCTDVTRESFVHGERSGTYGRQMSLSLSENEAQAMRTARSLIWKEFSGTKVKVYVVAKARHLYLDPDPVHLHANLWDFSNNTVVKDDQKAQTNNTHIHTFTQDNTKYSKCILINTMLAGSTASIGPGSVVLHSALPVGLTVGSNCVITGLEERAPNVENHHLGDETVLACYKVFLTGNQGDTAANVMLLYGLRDKLLVSVDDTKATVCGIPWDAFMKRHGITNMDLWERDVEPANRNLFTARLYPCPGSLSLIMWMQGTESAPAEILARWKDAPRYSMQDILARRDPKTQFGSRRDLFYRIAESITSRTLLTCSDQGLNHLYRGAAVDGYGGLMLEALDRVACECGSPGIAARTLANMADVLGAMARGRGGLRSGPAANLQWARAFTLLESGDVVGGVRALAEERSHWLDRPDHLVRAARHYEGAAQILIRHAVMSARKFIRTTTCEAPPMGRWVTAESPARVDIAGGWSDTPPITYEHGGAVINAAITIDGQKPIGAKVRRIGKPQLELSIGDAGSVVLTLTDLGQFADYCQPHAPGALLKTAFLCAEIVEYPSDKSLAAQLTDKYGGGFELHSWSNLPHGSGLGTSSILSGAIMAALWTASGKHFDITSLNHAVLHLEQMLTTGGGWQDQVGGLTGGIKVGHSAPSLPLKVDMTFPAISRETTQAFSERLVLVYTGKTRLARNLLQNVLRNWYARNPDIVQTEDDLVSNAWRCAEAFEAGDLEQVGRCMNAYWEQKKKMAAGCEPQAVSRMMAALRPHTHGLSLAGAGGGGFMYVLTREPHAVDRVRALLSQGTDNISVHEAAVDPTGLQLTVEGTGHVNISQTSPDAPNA